MDSSKMPTMGQGRSKAASALCIQIAHCSALLPLLNLKHMDRCDHTTPSNVLSAPHVGGLAMQSDPSQSPWTLWNSAVSTPASAEAATCRGRSEKGNGTD